MATSLSLDGLRKSVLSLFVCFDALVALTVWSAPRLSAQTHIGVWNQMVHEQWWQDHVDAAQWQSKRELIHSELLDVFQRLGASAALVNESFIGWTHHLKWLSLLPEDPELHASFVELALHDKLRGLFLDSLSPYDDHAEAMAILCRIHRAHPRAIFRYQELAVALSVVFDQPFPQGWPHHFVEPSSVLRKGEPPEKRFAFYLISHEKDLLLSDPTRLTVDQLKFVIDTPVPLEELHHLQGVQLRSLQQLQWLFQVIPYDLPRIQNNRLIWPHGPYRVFTIQNKGGLCVDQAYFTVHTAKAKGVPSVFFLGQGNSGEHAWVGVLDSQGRWNFDVGKVRSERYPVGTTRDPQTWRYLTDSQCIDLFRAPVAAAARARARLCHAWVELNPGAGFIHNCLQLARKASTSYLWAWEYEADFLETTGAAPEVLVSFWQDFARNFASNNDLRFRGERRLLIALEAIGDTRRYDPLFEQVVGNQRDGRFDLATSLSAERVFTLIEKDLWDEADQAFDKALARLRGNAGGHLFYELIQPYVQSCLQHDRSTQAADALERSTRHFRAQSGSILDRDLEALQRLVKARSGD